MTKTKMKMNRKLKGSLAEAKAYALKLLGYRSRSRKEMLERLKLKGFSEEQIKSTISFLEATDLINDEDLASELFRHSVENKSLGKIGIRGFLARRGIEKDLIEKNLSDHTTEIEEKSALKFIEKKLRAMNSYPEEIIRRKLWGMLQRRGISGDVIKRTLKSIKQ